MLCPNANVCFGGIGFEQRPEPLFDCGETTIEIQPPHVRLSMRGRELLLSVSKGADERSVQD